MTFPVFKFRSFIASLSFRTGVIVLALCGLSYLVSFAQMAVPCFSVATKGVLWVVFFGLAKTLQYTALAIIGKEGVVRIRRRFSQK